MCLCCLNSCLFTLLLMLKTGCAAVGFNCLRVRVLSICRWNRLNTCCCCSFSKLRCCVSSTCACCWAWSSLTLVLAKDAWRTPLSRNQSAVSALSRLFLYLFIQVFMRDLIVDSKYWLNIRRCRYCAGKYTMRLHEIVTIKPIKPKKPLTPAQLRISSLKVLVGNVGCGEWCLVLVQYAHAAVCLFEHR